MNLLLRDEDDPIPQPPLGTRPRPKPGADPFKSLAAQVASKLEEGHYTGAIHLACSEDSIAPLDKETVAALQAKHPTTHPHTCMPPPIEKPISCSSVSVEGVELAIRSYPNGSAGGNDGLRPQHLKDMVSASAW